MSLDTLSPTVRDRRAVLWTAGLALLLFAASFALYARTMAPGLLDGDEGEFQINIFRLGVSHTGYPTFFLLGKLWTMLIPIGTIATRANLFSAFWGALAVVAIFLLIHFLTRNHWAALLSALLLTASRVEWSQAIIPRPYTLNSLFVIAVPFLFFLWRAGKVDLTVPFFAFGLSLTNHRTIMWFGPAIALFILIADYRTTFGEGKPTGGMLSILRLWLERSRLFKPRRLLALAVALGLPLLLYGYVFWRGESDVGVEFHWKDFNDEILGGYVRASWRFGPLDWLISRVTQLYIPMLIEQFTVLGFLVGIIGGIVLALDQPPRGWPSRLPAREVFLFILLANLANSAFCVIFWVIDIDKFFLPSFITFLFFTGIGIVVVWDWLSDRPRRGVASGIQNRTMLASAAGPVAAVLVFLGATVFLVYTNFPLNDWSRRTDVARTWDDNLAQSLEPNAVIAGSWESITPLEYAMYIDGRRRDLERWKLLVKNYQLGQVPYGSRQEDIEKAVREGRPVYLTIYPGETETLGGLLDEFRLTRVGDLWRVVDAPPVDTDTLAGLRGAKPIAVFKNREGNGLELLGYAIHPTPALRSGDFGLVTCYWRLPQSFAGHLSVSLRLTDAQNHLLSQRDAEPASGQRPTNGWLPGEVVQDDMGFIIPPDAPPGDYHLSVVVYNTETGETLRTTGGDSYSFVDLSVARPLNAPPRNVLTIPHPLDVSLPPLRLLGYAIDNANPKGGDLLNLSLWWQLDQPTAHGETVRLVLQDASGRTAELYSGAPVAGFPAGEWGRAAVLRARYSLAIPLDYAGPARLIVQSQDNSTDLRINIRPSGRSFSIARIPNVQMAQVGDSVKLLGYDLDKTRAKPGETVRLTLYWQALKTPTESYTVFAHALDAGGVLRGQKDSVPRNGDLPTDRWLPDEVIVDSYDIPIAPDAPPGSYQFEVGMYRAETGERISVNDANGARLRDDRILLDARLVIQ